MRRHTYRVGILPWTLDLTDGVLTIQAAWGQKRVSLDGVRKVGIACTRYDAAALAVPAVWSKTGRPLHHGDQDLALPAGPAGLVLLYEVDGRTKDAAVTFAPTDAAAVEIVQAVLDATSSEAFVGVGSTPSVRASMGLGGGDFVAGVMMFVGIGAVVALLMWLGVL